MSPITEVLIAIAAGATILNMVASVYATATLVRKELRLEKETKALREQAFQALRQALIPYSKPTVPYLQSPTAPKA